MSETALAPSRSAAIATAGTSEALGVSLTISGLSVSGLTALISRATSSGSAPMTSPVSTFGQETLSSSAGHLVALRERGDEPGHLVAAEAHHVDDQRNRQLGQLGQVVGEVALEPLVGQTDRVHEAGGQLP